ncbi:serine/threonine protein kinase [Paracoccidioides brasiliensis Pb03]|nr:serine/threonine protein kinase [Paracoccidioides brasiliensis Pb03]
MSGNTTNIKARCRDTLFPRGNPVSQSPPPKRLLLGTEHSECSQKPQKLRRMIPGSSQHCFSAEGNPWDQYQRSFNLPQAGHGILVHTKSVPFDERIFKQIEVKDKSFLSKLRPVSHRNIVTLHEAMYHEGRINVFYEVMDVSLAQIFRTPISALRPFEVAAFCKEILEGLDYIHSHLELVHGELSSESILLSTRPLALKIANIAAGMIKGSNSGTAQSDVESLGRIIVECLEPGTAARHGDALVLDTWDIGLREFQALTKKKTAKELLKHEFLRCSPGPSCLRRYVRVARESAPKDIEIPPEWATDR